MDFSPLPPECSVRGDAVRRSESWSVFVADSRSVKSLSPEDIVLVGNVGHKDLDRKVPTYG